MTTKLADESSGSDPLARSAEKMDSLISIVHDLGQGDDFFKLQAEEQEVLGGKGNDTIVGIGRKDLLDGQAGDDKLIAKGNRDLVIGGKGDDILISRGSHDYLIGGKGENIYRLRDRKSAYVFVNSDNNSVENFNPKNHKLIFPRVGEGKIVITDTRKDFYENLADFDNRIVIYKNEVHFRTRNRYKLLTLKEPAAKLNLGNIYSSNNMDTLLHHKWAEDWSNYLDNDLSNLV